MDLHSFWGRDGRFTKKFKIDVCISLGFVSVIVFRLVCITYKDSIFVYFIGLCDIARLILILHCLASIFNTIIDTIFVYRF